MRRKRALPQIGRCQNRLEQPSSLRVVTGWLRTYILSDRRTVSNGRLPPAEPSSARGLSGAAGAAVAESALASFRTGGPSDMPDKTTASPRPEGHDPQNPAPPETPRGGPS